MGGRWEDEEGVELTRRGGGGGEEGRGDGRRGGMNLA